jgi:polysaccharide biosynthesis protein PslH
MRILMIADHVPFPPTKGTSIRNYNLLTRIAPEHEVWLVAFAPEAKAGEAAKTHMLTFCKGVETVRGPVLDALTRPAEALRFLARGRPLELRHYQSPEMCHTIRRLISRVAFDVVDIIDSHMALYLEVLPQHLRRRAVLTFIDVVASKSQRISRVEPKLRRRIRIALYGRMMRRWEPAYAGRFARCITVSDSDRQALLSRNPRLSIDIVPNGIDTKANVPLPFPEVPTDLLFVGNMGYRPNIDAMHWFCRDILPLIKSAVPGAELWITGLHPPAEVRALAGDGVHVTGTVSDVRPFYERSAVCIVPLRAGGGTRLKILEAMALGRPVVSTTIGAEGLDVMDGEHLFLSNTAEDFARKTLLLLADEAARQALARRGRELVEEYYEWDVIARQLVRTYTSTAALAG